MTSVDRRHLVLLHDVLMACLAYAAAYLARYNFELGEKEWTGLVQSLPLAQLAVAFTLQHPCVTSAIIGPRTQEHLEGLLPAAELRLDTGVLDRIDALVPPGSSVNPVRDLPDGTLLRRDAGA